jgi:hypothetical protein
MGIKPIFSEEIDMNVKRLDGRQLNYWVAKSAGLKLSADYQKPGTPHDPESGIWHPHTYNPANDWSQAGFILANEWFNIEDALVEWFGAQWPHIPAISENPLKWMMRAYVATQFGDEVEDATHADFGPAPEEESAAPRTTPKQVASKSSVSEWFKQKAGKTALRNLFEPDTWQSKLLHHR